MVTTISPHFLQNFKFYVSVTKQWQHLTTWQLLQNFKFYVFVTKWWQLFYHNFVKFQVLVFHDKTLTKFDHNFCKRLGDFWPLKCQNTNKKVRGLLIFKPINKSQSLRGGWGVKVNIINLQTKGKKVIPWLNGQESPPSPR